MSRSLRRLPKWHGVLPMAAWFSLVYTPVTVLLASRKPLWNDELFTYYIAQLGSFHQIWAALLTAADQNPPIFYWLTHVSMKALPGSLLAIRLPEIFGFWLLGVCLIAFVSRHLPPAYGLLAALLAVVSGAYPYAYEARPYGLTIGLAAFALLCWQRAEHSRVGAAWAAGLAVSLALAVSVHYYNVLLFVPLAAAEVVRWLVIRRHRWLVWVALGMGGMPLVVYLPLIRSATSYSQTFWAKVDFGSLNDYFAFVLVPALLPLAALALWASAQYLLRFRSVEHSVTMPAVRPPLIDAVAVFGFVALPLLAVVIALGVTGAYTHRYALSAVVGMSVLGAWMLSAGFGGLSRAALTAAAVLSLFFVGKQVRTVRSLSGGGSHHQAIVDFLERRQTGNYPIAIVDPHLFFELSHEAPALRRRIFYVAEPRLALQHVGTDAVDRGVIGMSRWAPLQVRKLAEVTGSSQPFLVYGYPGQAPWDWLVQELSSLRVPMSLIGSFHGRLLFLAQPAPRA